MGFFTGLLERLALAVTDVIAFFTGWGAAAGLLFVTLAEALLVVVFAMTLAGLADFSRACADAFTGLLERDLLFDSLAIAWSAGASAAAFGRALALDLDVEVGAGIALDLEGEFADFLICFVLILFLVFISLFCLYL